MQKRQAYEQQIEQLKAQLAAAQQGQQVPQQQVQVPSSRPLPASAGAAAAPSSSDREGAYGVDVNSAGQGGAAGASGMRAELQQQHGQSMPPVDTCQLGLAGAPSKVALLLGAGGEDECAEGHVAGPAPRAQTTHLPTPQSLTAQQGQQEEAAAHPSSEPAAANADPHLGGTVITAQQVQQEVEVVQPSSEPAAEADHTLGGTAATAQPAQHGQQDEGRAVQPSFGSAAEADPQLGGMVLMVRLSPQFGFVGLVGLAWLWTGRSSLTVQQHAHIIRLQQAGSTRSSSLSRRAPCTL